MFFVSNGYPYKLVKKMVNESWIVELKRYISEEFGEKSEKMNILKYCMRRMLEVSQKGYKKSSTNLEWGLL